MIELSEFLGVLCYNTPLLKQFYTLQVVMFLPGSFSQ